MRNSSTSSDLAQDLLRNRSGTTGVMNMNIVLQLGRMLLLKRQSTSDLTELVALSDEQSVLVLKGLVQPLRPSFASILSACTQSDIQGARCLPI